MKLINPKNWLSKTQSKTLVVHLDKEDWQRFIPMSDYMRMTPSKLGRVLLKQVLLQFQHREELDNNVFKLSNHIPVVRKLSPREMEILKLVAKGTSNKAISRVLGIRGQTTKNHISSILRKLNAENRTHAVVLALEQNLVEPKISNQDIQRADYEPAVQIAPLLSDHRSVW
jgi:DNA-binding CsgD family transcriptional regulator